MAWGLHAWRNSQDLPFLEHSSRLAVIAPPVIKAPTMEMPIAVLGNRARDTARPTTAHKALPSTPTTAIILASVPCNRLSLVRPPLMMRIPQQGTTPLAKKMELRTRRTMPAIEYPQISDSGMLYSLCRHPRRDAIRRQPQHQGGLLVGAVSSANGSTTVDAVPAMWSGSGSRHLCTCRLSGD
jgi:hypothetical protein